MRHWKGDNRGLSLIEVLIAVTILAIVVTPFLRSFVTAAATNSKAKRNHKATVVAQSVMEGIKAEAMDQLAVQFHEPEQGFYVLPSGTVGTSAMGEPLVGELCYDINTGTYSNVEDNRNRALGVSYFYMDRVKEDASEYDVLVKIDATVYRSGTVSNVDEGHRYNGDKLAQLAVIDLDQDAMSVQKESHTNAAVNDFLATHTGVAESTVRKSMKRRITVSVDRILVGTEYKTMVSVEYKYTYPGEAWEYVKKQSCYDSMETGQELRSVYLYYYPFYPMTDGSSRDEILFRNNEKLSVNFYLVKQEGADATLENEGKYNVNLALWETDATSLDDMRTKLYTNLATNLFDEGEIAHPFYTVSLNGSLLDPKDIASKGIWVSEEKDRIFDIEVSVYERGEDGARAVHYPEEMRLTTLEGSKIE